MKLCPKCEATYDDEVVFCRKCGTKLVDHNVCPYCGKPISTEDVFCGACGHRLKEEPHSETTPEAKTEARKYNGSRILQIIFASLFFVVALLGVLGFFGDMISLNALGEKASVSISYFFGDGAAQIEQIGTQYPQSDYVNIELAFFIIYNILYFGGLAATLVTVGFGIYKAIIAIIKKQDLNKKFFLFVVLFNLPYLMMTLYQAGSSTSVNVRSGFGWGTSILLAADIISILCYAAITIYSTPKTTKAIASKSLVLFSMFLMFFTAVYGSTNHVAVANSSIVSIKYEASMYYHVTSYFKEFYYANYEMPNDIQMLLVSFGFSLVTFVLSYISILYLSDNKKPNRILAIIICGLTFVFALLTGILGVEGVKTPTTLVTIGGGVITSMVLSVLSIAPVAVSLGLKE